MSVEIQVKKRRDNKKKRKDDAFTEDKENASHEQPQQPKTTNGALNIHIHKEPTTGGGLCAKLLFFGLLTILAGLIALIIHEHRENPELTISKQEYSQFSERPGKLVDSVEESQEDNYEEMDEEELNADAISDEITSNENENDDDDTESLHENEQDDMDGDDNVEGVEEDQELYENTSTDEAADLSDQTIEEQDYSVELEKLDTDLHQTHSHLKSELLESPYEDSEESKEDQTVTKPELQLEHDLESRERYHSITANKEESEYESEQESGGQQSSYQFSDITNLDDWIIRDKLDQANNTLENE